MSAPTLRFTYIGGPTALLEMGGLRLLTDPTFDPEGGSYPASGYVLHKDQSPAVSPERLGRVDAVLLSHDHHFDNLDTAGRAFLRNADHILTTQAGALRLGGIAMGLAPWQMIEIPAGERVLRITATPARHGPAHADRGPVIGFALSFADDPAKAVYVSGDTVWYDDVVEVGRRFHIRVAVLFMGAAMVPAAGPWPLTFTAEEGVSAAKAFPEAVIVPVHYEGWEHLTEHRAEIQAAFDGAGLGDRLRWPDAGEPTLV